MDEQKLNITPTPDVLIALTNTPLRPLDAVCELIDNGIDAFRAADIEGTSIQHPWIQIHIPGESEVRRGAGKIRIADNGAGLDMFGLEKALTAGFSSKNQFDTLGLFGMGFNIASGKLGKTTVVTTARKSDDYAIQVVLDLPSLVSNRSFELKIEKVDKPKDFQSGTIVEISGWWEDGTQNQGFVLSLARISKPKLAAQIARRYATLLRRSKDTKIQFLLNDETISGFEHCVWGETRFVERAGSGRIPAQITFDQVLHTQRHCLSDRSLVAEGATTCSQCGGTEFRSIPERVRGWVGVQRFDDSDDFGIDVIRNGRAILVQEKDAFFSFTEELGQKSREYPMDQQYGRIVGEVHLDHVPVDFTKQDFQRASESWDRAMDFIRGKSLLEGKWDGDYKNNSPVGRIFKGYRKVRKPGRDDMYMGRYDEKQQKSVRISREIERDYFARFLNREEGYFDDSKWWKLVEDAQTPPIKGLVPCPICDFQNQEVDEECADCGHFLKSKNCVKCSEGIRLSAVSCPACGASQVPEVNSPWRCNICETMNSVDEEYCTTCTSLRGLENPLSQTSLSINSEKRDDLSFENRSFALAKGKRSGNISLETYVVPPLSLKTGASGDFYPSVAIKSSSRIAVYVDPNHHIFSQLGVSVYTVLATEVAQYLHALNSELSGVDGYSVSNVASVILSDVWSENLTWTEELMRDDIKDLLLRASELLLDVEEAGDFYKDLTPSEQTFLAAKLISVGQFDKLEQYGSNGRFLSHVSVDTLGRFFSRYPDVWFGKVWSETLPAFTSTAKDAVEEARARTIRGYQRALDDCADYLLIPTNDSDTVHRVRASLRFLQNKIS
jgi:hypothetical protein